MLPKNRISGIKIWTDEWQKARIGKFTSSRISELMQKKPCTDGFMTYVYQKVGEELTGNEIFEDTPETSSMRWGIAHEPEAIQLFGKIMDLHYVIVQQLIVVPDTRFMGTPDALIVHNESVDQNFYNVSTVEVKCPPTYQNYIKLFMCNTPEQLKECNGQYYWQVLDQMEICDCLKGYFVVHHPDFRAGNMNIIEFRKIDMIEDFRLLKERKVLAVQKFEEIRDELFRTKTFPIIKI